MATTKSTLSLTPTYTMHHSGILSGPDQRNWGERLKVHANQRIGGYQGKVHAYITVMYDCVIVTMSTTYVCIQGCSSIVTNQGYHYVWNVHAIQLAYQYLCYQGSHRLPPLPIIIGSWYLPSCPVCLQVYFCHVPQGTRAELIQDV